VSFRLQSVWKVDNSLDKLKAEFDNDYMTKLDEFLCSEHDHGGLAFAVPAIRNSRADEPGVRRPLRVLPPGVAA
jgi:hypothetical protein